MEAVLTQQLLPTLLSCHCQGGAAALNLNTNVFYGCFTGKMTMIHSSDLLTISEKALNLTVFILVANLLLGGVPLTGVTKTATQHKRL